METSPSAYLHPLDADLEREFQAAWLAYSGGRIDIPWHDKAMWRSGWFTARTEAGHV